MGSSSSSPMADAETHGQAFSKTEYTRSVMDQLLNYMIKQLSVRDLLHMSNPAECKKYVLFKANSIYQYFYELRIIPTKDARGLLTFRKVEDLVNPKGEQDKERQSLCLIVAYFYTRIFQIYGALALTLIDDMNAMTSSGIMSLPPGSDARLRTPGYYPQQPYQGKGGVGEEDLLVPKSDTPIALEKLKNFYWIRDFLKSDYTSSHGSIRFTTRFKGSYPNRGDVFIIIEDSLKDQAHRTLTTSNAPRAFQDATFQVIIDKMDTWATLDVETRRTPGQTTVKIKTLQFKNNFQENVSTDEYKTEFNIEEKEVEGKVTYVTEKSNTKISHYLADYFLQIVKYLKDAIKVHKNATDSGTISTSSKSEEAITDHLRIEKMIGALEKRKPLGHCIARALQLLKSEPFKNEPGISQICSATFADNKRMGIVKKGEPLSDSPGLFALANLFYDTITMGSANLTIGKNPVDGKSSMDQYIEFMKKLSEQYGSGILTSEEYQEKGLGSISNKRDKVDCSTSKDNIELTPDNTKKVHAIVKTMFQAQVTHAAKCFKIIEMLFNITYDKATKKPIFIKLHDNLISKGFPELERINREARELLVGYYTDCEDKYMRGMLLVVEQEKKKKNAANAALNTEKAANAAPPKEVPKTAPVTQKELDARSAKNAQLKKQREQQAQAQATKPGMPPPTIPLRQQLRLPATTPQQQSETPPPPAALPLLRRHGSDGVTRVTPTLRRDNSE